MARWSGIRCVLLRSRGSRSGGRSQGSPRMPCDLAPLSLRCDAREGRVRGFVRLGPALVALGWDSELEYARGFFSLRDLPRNPLEILSGEQEPRTKLWRAAAAKDSEEGVVV